jgi:hypothetical protein
MKWSAGYMCIQVINQEVEIKCGSRIDTRANNWLLQYNMENMRSKVWHHKFNYEPSDAQDIDFGAGHQELCHLCKGVLV